jgi:hypothetical protein
VAEDVRQGGGEALLLQADVNAPEAAHIRENNAEN